MYQIRRSLFMKNGSKKLLSLFSVGMLLLGNGSGFVSYQAVAVKPVISQDEHLGKGEFLGDDGRCYLLGDFVDRGNQVVVYDCFCKDDNENYVVKIPLEYLRVKQELCDKAEREIVLEILKMPTKERHSEFHGKIAVELKGPPPAPHKDPTALRRVSGHISKRCIDFSGSDSDSADERDSGSKAVNMEELFGADSPEEGGFEIDSFDGADSDREDETDIDLAWIARSGRSKPRSHNKSAFRDSSELRCSEDTASEMHTERSATFSKFSKPVVPCFRNFVTNPVLTDVLACGHIRNLVPIVSFVPHVERKFPYSIKQYLSGAHDLPKTESQFLDWAARIFDNILCSLIDLHALEICHRDVKSDNVFLNVNGEAKLGDLGAMCFFNIAASKRVGTPRYMAPEVFHILITPIDPKLCDKIDVFSLGIMALEVLAHDFEVMGSIPKNVHPEDYYEDRNKIISEKIDTFHLRVGGRPIPERWKNFLKACLDPNPTTRASAKMAKELLEEAITT